MRTVFRGSFCGPVFLLVWIGTAFTAASGGQEASSEAPDASALMKQLEAESPDDRIDAAVKLGAMGPYAQPAVEQLTKSLATDNSSLQYECIVALGQIGPMAHDAVESLTRFLSADSEVLQSAALESLRRIGTASPAGEKQIRILCQSENASLSTSAIRCLVMISGTDNETVRSSVTRLVKALEDDRAEVRNEAAVTLVEIGAPVVPAVVAALPSTDAQVRLKACDVLGEVGSAASVGVPALVKRLSDEDDLVIRAAATALGQIRGDATIVVPALKNLLKSESTAIRITAVRAIAEYGPEAADAGSLMLGLVNDENAMLRASAVRALGLMGDNRGDVVNALVKALFDGNGTVTVNAANALSQMGAPAVRALVSKISDKSRQKMVVEILGEMGAAAEPAVPALVELLGKVGDDQELRREVFIALASIGPNAGAATPTMMKILQDPKAGDARAGAAYVLAYIGEKKALPVLKEILKSAEGDKVLRSSAWAIVRLEPKNADNANIVMPHLVKAASSDMPLARKEAMTAFATLGPMASEALPALLEHAASDSEAPVRAEALHALAEIKAPAAKALPVAIASLSDPDPMVRNSARFLLGSLGKEAHGAAPQLRESLRRGEEFERVVSAWALVKVAPGPENNQAAIPLLVKALQHPNPRVRVEAAMALGTVGSGSTEVRSALESAREDQDPTVKEAVMKALKAVGKG